MPIDKSIDYSAITPEIKALTKLCLADNVIEPEMYVKYAVNRGLRDLNGNGVLTGLTEISEIQSSKMVDGEKVPCEGKLFYRGVDVEQIVSGMPKRCILTPHLKELERLIGKCMDTYERLTKTKELAAYLQSETL